MEKMTKGEFLELEYNKFKSIIKADDELNKFYKFFENFPTVADVIFILSFTFPQNLSMDELKKIMNTFDIVVSEDKLKTFYPIFTDFLTKFREV